MKTDEMDVDDNHDSHEPERPSPDLSCPEDTTSLLPSPDLSCSEDASFLLNSPALSFWRDRGAVPVNTFAYFKSHSYDPALEQDHLQSLIERENNFGFKKNEDPEAIVNIPNWVLRARLETIQWVLTKRTIFEFHSRTAYLSITLFDRFISLKAMPVNEKEAVIWLISVACLSLAAKLEESKFPPLTRYEVEDFYFANDQIQRMELIVLGALDWTITILTPYDFLDYVVSKLFPSQGSSSNSDVKDVKSKIERKLLYVMKDINLMHHRPSAIAAAAAFMMLDQNLTTNEMESRIKSSPDLNFLETGPVYTCYNILRHVRG